MDARVLVLSNGALSQSDSNGRTVAMLLRNYKPSQLAQFYTYGIPDEKFCDRFYRVTDGEALRSFIYRGEYGGPSNNQASEDGPVREVKKKKKTPLKMLIREFIWKYGCWCRTNFWKWVDEFKPNIILINLGDNIFLPNLAIMVAKKYNIPIIVFSTEEYPFKKYNYITKKRSLFYWIFNKKLNSIYIELSKYVKKGYFNSPSLKREYEKRYSYPCYIAMNTSQVKWIDNAEKKGVTKVSYIGNLGINRHIPLIEIANAIANVCPGLKLDVYGRIPNNTVEAAFANCSNINYKGFVKYDDVEKIIHESTLLVHAESKDPFYVRDLKFAFSTKLADSISSGTPLLIYGDKTMAAIEFISEEKCAFVCTESSKLEEILKKALTDISARKYVLEHAKKTKIKYFNESTVDLL